MMRVLAATAAIIGLGGLLLLVIGPAAWPSPAPTAPTATATAPVPPARSPIPEARGPFSFDQRLPAPPGAAPVPSPSAAPVPPDEDPHLRVLDRDRRPDLRNDDMAEVRVRGEPRGIDTLLAIATDAREDEVMRSWAVQHLGLAWEGLDSEQRTRVRDTLVDLIGRPTEGDLPPREALYALSQSAHEEERAVAIAAVDAGIGDDQAPRLDLLVRLAGELGLARHRERVGALTVHPSIAVSGAAREALRRLVR